MEVMKSNTLFIIIHQYFFGIINKGHERSVRAKKHILGSLVIRGGSILINLLLVPLTIHYLNPTKYGIWLTLSSIIGWLTFFDIGLGNGLRNRLAEAKARNDDTLSKILVSTTYALLSIITFCVFLLFGIVQFFLNWSKILNAPFEMEHELSVLALIVVAFFCLQFVINLICTVLTADQRPALVSLINLLSSGLSLGIIYIIARFSHGSMILLGLASGASPVIILIISSIFYYSKRYAPVRPGIKYIDFSYTKDLMSLGIKFFIIQIAAIIMFSTSNIILTQLFSPYEVTVYNVAFKYFSIITMIFSILITPYWSAITEAYVKNDHQWINRAMKVQLYLWLGSICISLVLLLFSNFFYGIWVGKSLKIPITLSFGVFIYINLMSLNSVFSTFLNGVGKITIILIISVLISILNIPLSIYFSKLFGISGVVISSSLCLLLGAIVGSIQYKKIISFRAIGIWNR
jgi:O-antigen/teichoic acid export membrane protein